MRFPLRILPTILQARHVLRSHRQQHGVQAATNAAHGHHCDSQPTSPREKPAITAATNATVATMASRPGQLPSHAR